MGFLKNSRLKSFWSGLALGILLTTAVFWTVGTDDNPQGRSAATRSADSASRGRSLFASLSPFGDSAFTESGDDHKQTFDHDEHARELARVETDPAFVGQLLDEYRSTTAEDRRDALLALLTYKPLPAVKAVAIDLLSMQDARSRSLGLALLANSKAGDPSVKQAASQTFASASDPGVLLQAARLLGEKAGLGPAEKNEIAGKVKELLSSDDAKIRAEALNQYANLNTNEGQRQTSIVGGLADESAMVRMSAFDAIRRHGLRSDAIKQQAVRLLRQPNTDADTRQEAAQVLGEYKLTAQERLLIPKERLHSF